VDATTHEEGKEATNGVFEQAPEAIDNLEAVSGFGDADQAGGRADDASARA
jgi:hypothetical protein